MPADQIKAGMQIFFGWKLLDGDINELNLKIKLASFLLLLQNRRDARLLIELNSFF